jgi:hypothetical protein
LWEYVECREEERNAYVIFGKSESKRILGRLLA